MADPIVSTPSPKSREPSDTTPVTAAPGRHRVPFSRRLSGWRPQVITTTATAAAASPATTLANNKRRIVDIDDTVDATTVTPEDHRRLLDEERARTEASRQELASARFSIALLEDEKAQLAVSNTTLLAELEQLQGKVGRLRDKLAEVLVARDRAQTQLGNAARVLRYHRRAELIRREMVCAFNGCPPLDDAQTPMFHTRDCSCTTSAGEHRTVYACGSCMIAATRKLDDGGGVGTACPMCRARATWTPVVDVDTLPERYSVTYTVEED
jgi:hypothetical protein